MNKQATLYALLETLQEAQRLVQAARPSPELPAEVETLLEAAIAELRKTVGIRVWPEPTVEAPDLATLEEWFHDSLCEATDGCVVEHDGRCPHGHPSWFLRLGLI